MFANYLVNLVGQFTGRKLSLLTPGAYANDLLNLPDNWMKNIVWRAARFVYFLGLEVNSKSHRRDSVRKTAMEGSKR
jgi:hypothetical protein